MTDEQIEIPGYDFGSPSAAISPLTLAELHQMEQTLGWTDEDAQILLRHSAFFEKHAEPMVVSWRAVIAAHPHLAMWFFDPDHKPDEAYKARVKNRFVQWAIDVATRPHDRSWLNYQEEIGLRHVPSKKNMTDGRHTPAVVPLRHLLTFLPVVLDIGSFLEEGIGDQKASKSIQAAWTKAVHLHIALWLSLIHI